MRHDLPATMERGQHRGQLWSVLQKVIIGACAAFIHLAPREPEALDRQASPSNAARP